MNKLLNICGRCMSFQLFSMKVQARCRQLRQQCPGLPCSPCGSEGCGGHMGHGCAGDGWGAQAEPARDPPPCTVGKNLRGRSHFTSKIILIPMKTLPGSERPLELAEASLGRRQCCNILNACDKLKFAAWFPRSHVFHCSLDLLLRPWSCSRQHSFGLVVCPHPQRLL